MGNGDTRGKPAGVSGVQLVATFDPAAPAETGRTMYFGGKTRFEASFLPEDGNKTVYLWARYYNDRHTGPWSMKATTSVLSDSSAAAVAAANDALKIAA